MAARSKAVGIVARRALLNFTAFARAARLSGFFRRPIRTEARSYQPPASLVRVGSPARAPPPVWDNFEILVGSDDEPQLINADPRMVDDGIQQRITTIELLRRKIHEAQIQGSGEIIRIGANPGFQLCSEPRLPNWRWCASRLLMR